jgi:hypothetical protein
VLYCTVLVGSDYSLRISIIGKVNKIAEPIVLVSVVELRKRPVYLQLLFKLPFRSRLDVAG